VFGGRACLGAVTIGAHKSTHNVRGSDLQTHSAIPNNLTRLPSYKLRHFTAMNTQLVLPRFPIVKFRVLIIGRANAGKTAILQRVCDTTENAEIYRVDSSGARHRVRSRSLWLFHLIISPGSTRLFNRGWAGLFLLLTADREAPTCAAWRP